MKHQLDATLCRFYFCRVTLHVSGACTVLHQVGVSFVLMLRQLKHSTLISLVERHGPADESTFNITRVSNYLATNRHGVTAQKALFFSTG